MFADADAAGADEDLSGDEVRGHEACHQVERYRPQHHVVFVRAPAGSFAVDVVAVQHDFPSRRLACLGCGGAHDEIAGTVVSHRFEGVGCFRRGVFGMRVVDVDTTPVRGDHVGDVELWGVGEQVRVGRRTFQSGAARVGDGVFLPVVPADMAA